MIEPRSWEMRLAMRLVGAEFARNANAELIAIRLHESLAKLVGASGFEVLLARALVLAKKDHPVLVDVVAGPGGKLAGLGEPSSDRVAVEQAGVAIVAYFIELLVVLMGPDLTMRLVHEVEQEASNSAPAPAQEEKT